MKNKLGRIRVFKGLYRRYAVYFYLFVAAMLILLGVSHHPVIQQIRISIGNVTSSVVSILYKPFEGLGYAVSYLSELGNLHEENIRLKQDNEKLLYWVNRSQKLKQENERLKKELHFVEPAGVRRWTAYIAADNGGSFSRSVLVRAGEKDGIKKGFIALYNEGVIGRIVDVGHSVSRLLLLTDFASRVPVFVGEKRLLGIVQGNNTQILHLTSLPEGAEVKIGDYITTSGHAGVFPPDLPIGSVSKVSEEEIEVLPFVSREDTSFVQLVDYGLTGLLETEPCEEEKQ